MITKIFDPISTHRDLIRHVSGEGDVEIVDPTNSFVLMLEAISEATSASAVQSATLMRSVYPTTCTNMSELLRHATGEELIGLYASPASATFTVFVNTVDILSTGQQSDLSNETKYVQISAGTKIVVQGVTYTTTNSVRIHYDGHSSIVEQLKNDEYGFNRYGSIRSVVHTDPISGKWVKFDIKTRQFDYQTHKIDIIGALDVEIDHPDSFWYISAKGIFPDGIKDLRITHSDIVYDLNHCTLKVEPMGGKFRLHLPNIYQINDKAPLSIEVTVHVTRGKFNANLGDFAYGDFILLRNSIDTTLQNVTIFINSTNIVTGGKDTKTLDEVRESIITNVTGPLITPVTVTQLKERANRDGYNIDLYSDMVTHRLFIISKNIDAYVFKDIKSDPDTYINRTIITEDNKSDTIVSVNGATIVKRYSLFQNGINGCLPVKDNVLLDTFMGRGGYTKTRMVEIMNNDRHFFTPFVNIIYPDKICRTFDFDSPELSDLEIVNRNTFNSFRVNISEYKIRFIDDAFEIVFKLVGLNTVNLQEFPILMQLSITDTDDNVMFFNSDSIPTIDDTRVRFKIPTNSYVTKDDQVMVKENGIWHLMDINVDIGVMIYTDKEVGEATEVYIDEKLISKPEGLEDITGITRENVRCRFVVPKDNLFNESNFIYTNRKYQTYDEDVPFFYESNVYAFELGECGEEPDMTIVHPRGTPKVDQDGNTIIRFKKGDIKLVDGKPIIDGIRGIELQGNFLMLEAEYKMVNDRLHDDAFLVSKGYINEFLDFAKTLDESSLESTTYKYRPVKDSGLVNVKVYDSIKHLPQQIRPEIELYVDANSNYNLDISRIGRVIQIEIEKDVISLDGIRKALAKELSIVGASVKSLGIGVLTEYITILRNQFALKKLMTPNNEVVYDIDVKIVTV